MVGRPTLPSSAAEDEDLLGFFGDLLGRSGGLKGLRSSKHDKNDWKLFFF